METVRINTVQTWFEMQSAMLSAARKILTTHRSVDGSGKLRPS